MTRHLASTRPFPMSYAQDHPDITVSADFPDYRPCAGGALTLFPLPAGLNGQPYLGMDPSAPLTWVRPYNPQPGMAARFNFDGAKMQADTPMGGTWRNVHRDRADVGGSWMARRRRR
jgi:hypothetical protein